MPYRKPSEKLVRPANFLALLAVLGIAALPHVADAATSTTTFTVNVTVPTSCTITATNVNFGTYDGANANATAAANANGTVSATCTQGTAPTIGLGAGANASSTQRRLKDSNTDYISYNLLQPSSSTPGAACNYGSGTAWGDGTTGTTGTVFSLTAAPSKAARAYNVCGVIPAGQDVPVNGTGNVSYNDTVTATITF